MGYEIIFHYYDKTENGYDVENPKEFKKSVGGKLGEVELKSVANVVLSQLARRDVFINDVEVYEYKRSKVNFKERKDGIVLKNQKFTFKAGEITEETFDEPQIAQTAGHQATSSSQVLPGPMAAPLRYEVFDPEDDLMKHLISNGQKIYLSKGKQYPVLRERIQGANCLYSVIDDRGQKVDMNSMCFVPIRKGLLGGSQFNNENRSGDPVLSYGDDNFAQGMMNFDQKMRAMRGL